MKFLTFALGAARCLPALLFLGLTFSLEGTLQAQSATTNASAAIPDPASLETPGTGADEFPPPRAAAVSPEVSRGISPDAGEATPAHATANPPGGDMNRPFDPAPVPSPELQSDSILGTMLAALITLSSLIGVLFYQAGLTRAKNCAHTCMLMLLGVVFGLAGYWMGGFAVQTGGIGDAHAALAGSFVTAERSDLDHELGLTVMGHHWGFMGSSGFFLMTDATSRPGVAALFLSQAAFVAVAIALALGSAVERGRLLAIGVLAFLIGVLIYPLFANWVWGGGWLAEMGREFGLGHGMIDLAGAGVLHETAGTLALAIALVLGPRQGRFTRNKVSGIPGHNVPFTAVGTLILLSAWMAGNGLVYSGGNGFANAGLGAVNVLLGAMGGMLVAVVTGAWWGLRATPVRLTRALLGGAVSLCGGSAWMDPWAAVATGAISSLVVEALAGGLARRAIDDPVNTIAIHLGGGIWGLLAVGLFANGLAGGGFNGIAGPVRGLFFGGHWHQLAAQAIGGVADFVVVFVLGYLSLHVVQKVLGNRVPLKEELQGLDWTQVGALGYQPDVDSEDLTRLP